MAWDKEANQPTIENSKTMCLNKALLYLNYLRFVFALSYNRTGKLDYDDWSQEVSEAWVIIDFDFQILGSDFSPESASLEIKYYTLFFDENNKSVVLKQSHYVKTQLTSRIMSDFYQKFTIVHQLSGTI